MNFVETEWSLYTSRIVVAFWACSCVWAWRGACRRFVIILFFLLLAGGCGVGGGRWCVFVLTSQWLKRAFVQG